MRKHWKKVITGEYLPIIIRNKKHRRGMPKRKKLIIGNGVF